MKKDPEAYQTSIDFFFHLNYFLFSSWLFFRLASSVGKFIKLLDDTDVVAAILELGRKHASYGVTCENFDVSFWNTVRKRIKQCVTLKESTSTTVPRLIGTTWIFIQPHLICLPFYCKILVKDLSNKRVLREVFCIILRFFQTLNPTLINLLISVLNEKEDSPVIKSWTVVIEVVRHYLKQGLKEALDSK